jgi:hypothetical protein
MFDLAPVLKVVNRPTGASAGWKANLDFSTEQRRRVTPMTKFILPSVFTHSRRDPSPWTISLGTDTDKVKRPTTGKIGGKLSSGEN